MVHAILPLPRIPLPRIPPNPAAIRSISNRSFIFILYSFLSFCQVNSFSFIRFFIFYIDFHSVSRSSVAVVHAREGRQNERPSHTGQPFEHWGRASRSAGNVPGAPLASGLPSFGLSLPDGSEPRIRFCPYPLSASRSSHASSSRVSRIFEPSSQERSSSGDWAPISAQVGNG